MEQNLQFTLRADVTRATEFLEWIVDDGKAVLRGNILFEVVIDHTFDRDW